MFFQSNTQQSAQSKKDLRIYFEARGMGTATGGELGGEESLWRANVRRKKIPKG